VLTRGAKNVRTPHTTTISARARLFDPNRGPSPATMLQKPVLLGAFCAGPNIGPMGGPSFRWRIARALQNNSYMLNDTPHTAARNSTVVTWPLHSLSGLRMKSPLPRKPTFHSKCGRLPVKAAGTAYE
jgi:hypothetical protein